MCEWRHEQLGTFWFEDDNWVGYLQLKGFARFAYGDSETEICIAAVDEEEDEPSRDLVDLTIKTIENHQHLISTGIEALWHDFNGNGPESGMWWHGKLDHVRDKLQGKTLESSNDLFDLLKGPSIHVLKHSYGYERPCSTIGFGSDIDDEHGIGLLSNGTEIIGLGYADDPSPFPKYRTQR